MVKKTSKITVLPKEIFEQKSNDILLATYVRVYLVNKRAWSAYARTRGDVVASKRKIYKQKGTGRARHGAISAPIFVGGGKAHGPKFKNVKLKINKKQIKLALFYSLSKANKEKRIFILPEKTIKISPKTKNVENILKDLKIYGKKILLIYSNTKDNSKNLILAVRNINNLSYQEVRSLNAYDVLSNEILLFIEDSLISLKNHYFPNEK